jgi:hypothetical protein
MIKIEDTLISDDIIEKFFICDLERCKGACCVEGELGAPLEDEELEKLNKNFKGKGFIFTILKEITVHQPSMAVNAPMRSIVKKVFYVVVLSKRMNTVNQISTNLYPVTYIL